VTAGPIAGNRIDRKAPAIAISAPAGSYTAGQPVVARYTCADAGSGIASCSGPAADGSPVDTSAPGPKTFTVTSLDLAGNRSESSVSYTVVAASRVTGSGYNFPELPAYRATFSVDVAGPSATPGAVKYAYSRTRLTFVSSAISTYSASGGTMTIAGLGSVNGAGGYTFTATVVDGSPDSFGIVVRRMDGSVYFAAAGQPLAGGAFSVVP